MTVSFRVEPKQVAGVDSFRTTHLQHLGQIIFRDTGMELQRCGLLSRNLRLQSLKDPAPWRCQEGQFTTTQTKHSFNRGFDDFIPLLQRNLILANGERHHSRIRCQDVGVNFCSGDLFIPQVMQTPCQDKWFTLRTEGRKFDSFSIRMKRTLTSPQGNNCKFIL